MLVCSVILRPPHRAIAAELAELAEALDAPATGNIVFATLVDDPASVNESVDAYLGEIMLEAASAVDVVTSPMVYATTLVEAAVAGDTQSADTGFTPANLTGLIGWWDASVTASLTLSGADILAMADQSVGGNNLSWDSSAKPQYNATGFNAKPAFVFGGPGVGNSFIKTSFPLGTGNTLTLWWVGRLNSASASTSNPGIVSYVGAGQTQDWSNSNSFVVARNGASTTQITMFRNGNTLINHNANADHRVIITIDSSGKQTWYIDGVSQIGSTTAGNWTSPGTLRIGKSASGDFYAGPHGEAGIASGYSDATTVGLLDTYLRVKWGSISQHTYTEFDRFTPIETTLSNGNLTATRATQALSYDGARSSDYKTASQYYFEMTSPPSGTSFNYGILNSAGTYQNLNNDGTNCLMVTAAGNIWSNNANTLKSVSSIGSGATVCFAVDLTARLGWVRKGAGNWNNDGTANPATGVGGVTIGSGSFAPAVAFGPSSVGLATTGNFGQSAYTQTPPSGFGNWPGA